MKNEWGVGDLTLTALNTLTQARSENIQQQKQKIKLETEISSESGHNSTTSHTDEDIDEESKQKSMVKVGKKSNRFSDFALPSQDEAEEFGRQNEKKFTNPTMEHVEDSPSVDVQQEIIARKQQQILHVSPVQNLPTNSPINHPHNLPVNPPHNPPINQQNPPNNPLIQYHPTQTTN